MITGKCVVERIAIVVFAIPLLFFGCSKADSSAAGGNAPAANTSAASTTTGLPPDLVKDVEEVIRLTGEYNALAAQVQDAETFKQHRDELSRIDGELSPFVENVMIGEAKLSAADREQFNQQYYLTRAQPLIEEKSKHQARIASIVP